MYICLYICIYMYIYMCICICIDVYIYIHIYVSRSTSLIFSPGQGAGLSIYCFLSLVLKTQHNPWTKRMVSTRLTT